MKIIEFVQRECYMFIHYTILWCMSQVNFGLFRGDKPLLVVADPRPGSGDMREAMRELNTRMPRKVRLNLITNLHWRYYGRMGFIVALCLIIKKFNTHIFVVVAIFVFVLLDVYAVISIFFLHRSSIRGSICVFLVFPMSF